MHFPPCDSLLPDDLPRSRNHNFASFLFPFVRILFLKFQGRDSRVDICHPSGTKNYSMLAGKIVPAALAAFIYPKLGSNVMLRSSLMVFVPAFP